MQQMNIRTLVLGAGAGAALAFIADPDRGHRRRALLRDQMVRAGRKSRDTVDATTRDLANRTKGVVAAARGRVAVENVDATQLLERVRARLGRACSHPRAIGVDVANGNVTLRGPIVAGEVDAVLAAVAPVRGVRTVTNELASYESTDRVPSLQGAGRLGEPTLDVLQGSWAPATQALVAAAGVAATALCLAYVRR
jgi:BON domain